MQDLHAHICYGIDDGAKTIEESISILKKMYNEGFTDIFLTPHYIEDSKYQANNKEKLDIIDNLKKACLKENININLYPGNEVYLSNNTVDLIKKNEIMTLNNSKYILIEFSLHREDPNLKLEIQNLIDNGYIPIVAHPERYPYTGNKQELIYELKDMGVLFQGNYRSLFGKYGHHAKKKLQKLLKNDIISFIGSDIHHDYEFYTDKIYKELKKYLKDDKKVNDLLNNSLNIIIDNK